MALPTQYELVSLYYQAIAAGVTPANALNDVKAKWQIAAKKLREVTNDKEFEMTQAEIDQDIIDTDANGVTSLQELKPVWEQELIEEIAGHNRPWVIAELQANIASVPA